jgi:membrane protease YdiL (CAAX protease family)
MKKNFIPDFDRKDIHYYAILLSAPILLTLYRYHGFNGAGFFFPDSGLPEDQLKTLYQFSFFFLISFIIPALYVVLIMKKSLTEFGLGIGNIKKGLITLIVIPVLVIPLIYISSKIPDIRMEYPLAKSLLSDQSNLLLYQSAYIIFYYIGWEFFFRGFLLFGLKGRFGEINAILIQTISSCLLHIGKPEGEILGSIIIGILFGIIALRTRSIWYVFLIHAAIGVFLDIFIIYG